jgi:hypothetical protein
MSVASGSVASVKLARIQNMVTGGFLNQYSAVCKVEVQNRTGTTTYPETAMTANDTQWTHDIPATAFTRGQGPWKLLYRVYAHPSGALLRTFVQEEPDANP